MHRYARNDRTFVLPVLAVAIVIGAATQSFAAEAGSDTTFAKKRAARAVWERIVSFPTDVVDLALDIPFEITKGAVGFVYEAHVVEKVSDLLTADDGSWGVVPVVKPRGGGGAKYFHRDIFVEGGKLEVHAVVGRYQRQSYGVAMKRLSIFGGALTSGFDVGYDFDSDDEFFGLGPGTRPGDESNYAHESARAEMRLGKAWGEKKTWYVGGLVGVDHNNILDGRRDDTPNALELPDAAALIGAGDQIRMGRVGIDVVLDTRDFAGSPARGWLAEAGADWYRELDDDVYGFWKLRADVSTNIDVAYRRVLEFRVAGEFTARQSGRATPFYYLSSLGNYATIRGISNARFRDANAVLASVEYRWPVRRGTDATLFVDGGNVYDNPDNFRRDFVEVSWGGGFRVYGRSGLIATIEAARSRDEWRFYFVLN